MKKIAVFSDLHIPSRMKEMPFKKLEPYKIQVDMIFGLGDYVNQDSLDCLYAFNKQVHAVCGNMDSLFLKETLPFKLFVHVEEVKIGLTHGWGAPFQIKERIYKEFIASIKNHDIDAICYGHTHSSYYGELNKVKFFNPGSLSGHPSTFGILTVDHKKIKTEIIEI